MDFSALELPLQLKELMSKAFISAVVIIAICTLIKEFIAKFIPRSFIGGISLVIIAILFWGAYELWPYIPVIF
ncbi:TPA: hypothetical protein ROX88_001165 [Bacillus pseudomycoides]|nr:hypothetical protein [Bacillus pseudomycoides]